MLILFMFVSFTQLTSYFESKNTDALLLSAVTFGLGISIKYSLLLWMLPISLMIMYYRKKSPSGFIFNCIVYTMTGLILVAAAKTSVNILPGAFYKGIVTVFTWGLVILGIRYGLKKYESAICGILEQLLQRRILIFSISLIAVAAAYLVFHMSDFNNYSDDFITDRYLFFNVRMYKYMVVSQFKNYMTENLLYASITGFLLVLAVCKNNITKIVISFSFGSLFYWILTSKVMFFHNYYTLIIMITGSILAGFAMYYILFPLNSKLTKILIGGLLFLFVFPTSFRESTKNISKYEDYSQAIEFIKEHTDGKDKLIYEGPLGPIAIYTRRSLVRPYRLDNDQIRKEIRETGFADAMRKYGIKYLLSPYEKPKYIDYANLFSNTKIYYPSSNRRYLILERIGMITEDLSENYSNLEDIVREYNIHDKFILVSDFGNIKIYSLHN
jgi:hypothetical protein